MKRIVFLSIILAGLITYSAYGQRVVRFGWMSSLSTNLGHANVVVGWDSAAGPTNQPDTTVYAFHISNYYITDTLYVVVDPDTIAGAGGRNRKITMDYTTKLTNSFFNFTSITNSNIGTWKQLEDSLLYGGYAKYSIPHGSLRGDSLLLRFYAAKTDTSGWAIDKNFSARVNGFLQTKVDPVLPRSY